MRLEGLFQWTVCPLTQLQLYILLFFWLGHVERMEVNARPKRMLRGRLHSKRSKGRSTMRWLDNVESDLKKMKVKGWKEKTRNREQWRLIVEEAKAHPGL
jgi:hypothetical protein